MARQRYAVALASVVAGFLVRFALGAYVGANVPFATLLPPVMFAAWYGGFGPGMLAAVLSVVGAFCLILPFPFPPGPTTSADLGRTGIFLGFSIFNSVLSQALRRSRARSEEHLRLLTIETDRLKRTEQELAESNREALHGRDLLHITLSSIGDAVISTNAVKRVTFLNAVAQQLTGWSQHDALGRQISEIFSIRHELTRLAIENPVDTAIRENAAVSLGDHTILVSKDGREIPIEESAAPIRDEDQRVLGAILVFRDVTERRKSSEALKNSEARLQLALDTGEIGVWDWDVINNRLEWSDLVYDFHGVEHGKPPGRMDDYVELIHPDDREPVTRAIAAALQDGTRYGVDFRVNQPNGGVRWISTTAQVFRNGAGDPVRMLGALTDITARKQADSELRRQWHNFDTALSYTPDFTYTFDLDGRFTYVNRALLALWQKPLEEAVGKNFFDLGYPDELAARLQRQVQEVIDTRLPLRDQTPFTSPTGDTGQYEYIFVPVCGIDGTVEAVAGSTRDTTERSKSEEAVRKSEERLTLALEAGGGVGTWDWDVPSDRVYCDPRFAALFSLEQKTTVTGAPIAEFISHIHPDDRERIAASIWTAAETGGDYSEEYRVIEPDGFRWVHARGRCHLDEAGKPSRFPGVAFDISERKRSEEKLRESQQRMRAIYDGTYEYIGLLAPDGTLLEANRAFLGFANMKREDVLGRRFWDTPWFAFTPGASGAVKEAIKRAAEGEFIRFEALITNPEGENQTFDLSFYPVRNENDEVILIVPEGRNITELKRAEEELRRSNQGLVRANRELEEFAYVASHDLQEPLRMVNIYTQLLVRELGDGNEKLHQFAGFVTQGVSRMETLIRDLLTLSRTADQAEAGPVGTANLAASLAESLVVLKSRIDDCGAVITVTNLPAVTGETSQISHVFQNLISNALKYHKPGKAPEIHISAVQHNNEWMISIRDNGIGFDQSYAERIFGLFKRLHRDEYPGTGLGLAICKRIVERYGGRIWAESQPDEGATFYFTLRTAAESSQASTARP
jgi:PAS domain S-box-containing protein